MNQLDTKRDWLRSEALEPVVSFQSLVQLHSSYQLSPLKKRIITVATYRFVVMIT